jgi:cyclophilin family peptidyl-prolyl cis-trans isomerase
VRNFVIQTGGFEALLSVPEVVTKPPVNNEFRISNTRGTVAMARAAGQTNSATSQWFVNLADNSRLDTVDGGFTVFARVRGNGMTVVDKIAQLPVITNFDAPFNELPVRDIKPGQRQLLQANLVPIHDVTRLPFSARSSDPSAWSASLSSNNVLSVTPGTNAAKPATIIVEATDMEGRTAKATFVVKPAPARNYVGLTDSTSSRALVSLALSTSGAFSLSATAIDTSILRLRGQLDRTGASGWTTNIDGVGQITLRYVPASDLVTIVTPAGTFELRPASGSSSLLSGKLANVLLSGGGDGFVQLRFDSLGMAKLSGRLADGSKFTGSLRTVLGSALDTPLLPFLSAWKTGPSAALSGNIAIDATAKTFAGTLSLKPRTAAARNVSAAGAFWTAPTSGTLPFRLRFESGGIVVGLPSQPVGGSWTPPGKPALAAGSPVSSFTMNPSSGLFTGKVGSVSFSGLFTGPLPGLDAASYGGGVAGPVSGATSRVDVLSP